MAEHCATRNRKYILVGVAVTLALALVLTGVLVGVLMTTEVAQMDMMKLNFEHEQATSGELMSDLKANRVQYRINSTGFESWIEDDFNRGIRVIKLNTTQDGLQCFIDALNRMSAVDPKIINAASKRRNQMMLSMNTSMSSSTSAGVSSYEADDDAISDTSFLSNSAREMCSGVSIYWVQETCTRGDGKSANIDFRAFFKSVLKIIKEIIKEIAIKIISGCIEGESWCRPNKKGKN